MIRSVVRQYLELKLRQELRREGFRIDASVADCIAVWQNLVAGESAEDLFGGPVTPSGGHDEEDLPFHDDGSIFDIEDALHIPTTQDVVYEHEQSEFGDTQFLKPEVDYDFLR